MRLAIQVSSDNDLTDDPDFCIVELTPEFARKILQRADRFKAERAADVDANETYYWSWGCAEYPNAIWSSVIGTELVHQLVECDFVRLPETATTDYECHRMECEQMAVDDRGVRFHAIPKHCDWYVRSREIPLGLLREIAGTVTALNKMP